MCVFPSWIVAKNGKEYWLTDKLIADDYGAGLNNPCIQWNNVVGHGVITRILGPDGLHCEDWKNIPKEFAADINAGRCNRMLKGGGYKSVKITYMHGHTYVKVEFDNGDKQWLRDGVLHRGGNKPACIYKYCETILYVKCVNGRETSRYYKKVK